MAKLPVCVNAYGAAGVCQVQFYDMEAVFSSPCSPPGPLPPMSDRCRLYLVACVQENHIHHPPSVAPNPQQTNL